MPSAKSRIKPVNPPATDATDTTDAREGRDDAPHVERSLTPAEKKLHKQLTEFYQTIAITVATPLDALGGQLLFHRSEELAENWIVLAKTNPKVKKVIENLLSASGIGTIIVGHAAIVLAVLANRGAFPDEMAGGIAMFTCMQTPEVRPFFNHPRFHPNVDSNGTS